MKNYLVILVMTLALILVAGHAKAGYVGDRTTLESLLVGGFLQEDFESIVFAPGQEALRVPTPYGFPSGVQFLAGPDGNLSDSNVPQIQFNNLGYYQQPSKDIMAYYSKTLVIDFTGVTGVGVDAFGFDLLTFVGFPNFSDNATIKVYGNNDQLLYETPSAISVPEVSPLPGVFFGFADDSGFGIKEVYITGVTVQHEGSPIIDDLSFGSQVPIPGAVWLLGSGLLGLVGLRRKFK